MEKKYWIARNDDNTLYVFDEKPILEKARNGGDRCFCKPSFNAKVSVISSCLFEEVTPDNSPVEFTISVPDAVSTWKIGDVISPSDSNVKFTIIDIVNGYYLLSNGSALPFTNNWIHTDEVRVFSKKCLRPFDKVLVRDYDDDEWEVDLFGRCVEGRACFKTSTSFYEQCVPYNEGTEHLLGSSGKAPKYYITWETKE